MPIATLAVWRVTLLSVTLLFAFLNGVALVQFPQRPTAPETLQIVLILGANRPSCFCFVTLSNVTLRFLSLTLPLLNKQSQVPADRILQLQRIVSRLKSQNQSLALLRFVTLWNVTLWLVVLNPVGYHSFLLQCQGFIGPCKSQWSTTQSSRQLAMTKCEDTNEMVAVKKEQYGNDRQGTKSEGNTREGQHLQRA